MTEDRFDWTSSAPDDETRIEEEAYAWLSINHADTRSPAEIAAFEMWLRTDPRHAQTYDGVQQVWQDLAELDDLTAGTPDPKVSPVAGWMGAVARAPRSFGAIAAALIMAVMIALFIPDSAQDAPDSFALATAHGDIRDEVLADGSTVTLGAESWMTVDFTPTERRVSLKAGEAFFSVTKSDPRPFVVTAGDTTVRVLGTEFDVRLAPNQVRVGVLEGVVEVEQAVGGASAARSLITLPAGQRIVATRGEALAAAQRVTFEEPGAWRDGRLIYVDAPLSQVIADANRYFEGQLIVESDTLNALSVSASFRTDNREQLIAALGSGLPIATEYQENGDILVRAVNEQ